MPADELGAHAIAAQLAEIRQDLDRLGVRFDGWFHEQSLFDSGAVDAMLQRLRDAGRVVEREGAVWFAATRCGLDKDEVLIRSNGMPTYFMTDIAYHLDKFESALVRPRCRRRRRRPRRPPGAHVRARCARSASTTRACASWSPSWSASAAPR